MALTSAQKQRRRRAALDEVAAELGYDSHYKMMTAIANREAIVKLNFDEPKLTCDDGGYEPITKKKYPTLEINGETYIIREWGRVGDQFYFARGWNENGFPIEFQFDEKFGAMLFPDMIELMKQAAG